MKKTLLLVDDERNILNSLTRILSDESYEILNAINAEEGLNLLSKNDVQVVITDQRMPNVTGCEFLKTVKKTYPDTVRMILSGYADFDAVKDAVNEGSVYKFLTKPWDNDLIRQQIQDAFEYHSQTTSKLGSLQEEEKLKKLLDYDKLTGLPDRLSFTETLRKTIDSAKKNDSCFCILWVDLDRFSNINHSFGNHVGDQLLQIFAKRLKAWIGNKNTIARLGSDDFAIILSDFYDPNILFRALGTLLQLLKTPYQIDEKRLYVSSSIGVSLYPKDSEQCDVLIERAKSAHMKCKELGGDNIQFYNVVMEKGTSSDFLLENELRQAIETEQFAVFYQPVVCLHTGQIKGVEALLRWLHPQRGMIAPDKFLPICESTGLIVPLGEWVLRTACQDLKSWHNMGRDDLFMAVNLSTRQFFNYHGLYEMIERILKLTELSPSFLEIEITETLIMQNVESVITILQSLRNLGLHLALDDFGTGYASINYLKNFPFDILKIDKYFVQEVGRNVNNEALLIAIISMGKNLGLSIVAEGIETIEQLKFLKRQGCDYVQGYLLSKALPAHELMNVLHENNFSSLVDSAKQDERIKR